MMTMHLVPLGIGAAFGLTGKGKGGAFSATVEFIGLLGFALGVMLVGYILYGEGTSEMPAATALFFVYSVMMFLPYLIVFILLVWGGWSVVRFVRRMF